MEIKKTIKGQVYWIHVKELEAWTHDLNNELEDNSSSNEDSTYNEAKPISGGKSDCGISKETEVDHAWDRYKDLLRVCPHHGFIELHQLDTFYNALNLADQDSLNSATGGNLLERRTQDVLTIIEHKSKVCNSRNKSIVSQVKSSDANSSSSFEIAKLTHAVDQQTSDVTTAMTAILKQFQATPPPASVKVVDEIYVTCGGAHPYYQCLAADGNTFLEFWDNIQGYVSAAAVNYNQGYFGYRPPSVSNQIRPPGFAQPNVQNNQNRFSQPQGYNRRNNFNQDTSYQAPIQQNQVVSLKHDGFQMNTASTLGSRPLLSNTIANPKGELKAITTQSGLVLDGPSFPMPSPFINPMLKSLLSNKEKLLELVNTPLNENFSAVILKKLPEKLRDPGKFLIPCGFSELKCKALADLGASINLMPLSFWKNLGLPELISTRMTLELANRTICTPAEIARDVFVSIGKFTFLVDFVIVDYEIDPQVPLILGRPFLRTAHALIDVHREEMILRGGDERLTLNIRHDTSSYSNQPHKESINMINIYDDYLKDLFATNHLNSILEDLVDEGNLADPNNDLVDTIPEMFIDEHTLDYSSPPLYDDVDDDLVELKSSDFLPSPECDSVLYEIFSEVDGLPSTNNEDKVFNPGILIHENLSEVTIQGTPDKNVKKISISNASLILEDFNPPLYELPFHKEVLGSETQLLFSSKNEKKVFNPRILTSKGVHTSILPELSHRALKLSKSLKFLKARWRFFLALMERTSVFWMFRIFISIPP
uniref:Reverse transcriptase domain-containing protein n=1 Tax=Tanacetum cinerariifolium TaxID=118510 RepID=A0A6L2MWQ6_TANCI|nr:reverse transcriptase domain-containing protein [Tanacetum cinerariifolium]